jgi:hypothetical protein
VPPGGQKVVDNTKQAPFFFFFLMSGDLLLLCLSICGLGIITLALYSFASKVKDVPGSAIV